MRLHYFIDPHGNFGDDINAWLWQRFLPDLLAREDDLYISVIGTILNHTMPKDGRAVILGSGIGYGYLPDESVRQKWKVLCVRGPLTAKTLNLPPEKAVTDGAILLADLPEYAPLPESERKGVVFMPHHEALGVGKWREACNRAGIDFLDPRDNAKKTIQKIRGAKLVLADAMHAAIVADAMRVPWVPLATSPNISSFKWLDWTLSLGLPYRPHILPASSLAEGMKALWIKLLHKEHLLASATQEAALAHYAKRQSRASSPVWQRIDMAACFVERNTKRLLKFPPTEKILKAIFWNEAQLNRAANGLRRAAELSPFLSNRNTFEERLAQMKERIEALQKL